MTAMDAVIRPVPVGPMSARAELLFVLRVAMAIVVVTWIFLAAHFTESGATGRRNLLPFQKLIADRPGDEQRVFRELQEGLLEAEAARSVSGTWPDTPALAANGIPPFAIDPTRHSTYEWSRLQARAVINYLGIPAAAGSPAWLVLITEPQPGVPPDQAFEDEEHHRLANGAMLHVSVWVHAGGTSITRKIISMPQSEGWTQLYAVGPSSGPPSRGPL